MISSAMRVGVWGIVPAAGSSRRMGRPKACLPYGESTLVGTGVRTLLKAGLDAVVVVTRSELVGSLDLPEDARLRVAFNEEAGSEMIDSVRVGLTHLAELERSQSTVGDSFPAPMAGGVLVVPADVPGIRVETYRACLAAFAAEPQSIVIAAYGGKRGHPMIFPWSLYEEVLRLAGGLRELVRMHADRVRLVETDDPAVTRDVDSPDDYRCVRENPG